MERALFLLLAICAAFVAFKTLEDATRISRRWKTNVWTAAKPELGAGLLCIVSALMLAAKAGGWL